MDETLHTSLKATVTHEEAQELLELRHAAEIDSAQPLSPVLVVQDASNNEQSSSPSSGRHNLNQSTQPSNDTHTDNANTTSDQVAFAHTYTAVPHLTNTSTYTLPEEWISVWLKPTILWLVAAWSMILMAGIIIVIVLSARWQGLGEVVLNSETPLRFIPNVSVGTSFFWTTVPVFLFQIYGLAVAAIVKAAGTRQPYVELRQQSREHRAWGASAERSVLLDYGSYWTITAPFAALHFNHWLLAFSFSIIVLLNLGLTSVAAHLFYTNTISFKNSIQLIQDLQFDGASLTVSQNLFSVIGLVSSVFLYGGQVLPWTTRTEAILPFSLNSTSLDGIKAKNVTVDTVAYSAEAACTILGRDNFAMAANPETKMWVYAIRDGDCEANSTLFTYEGPSLSTFTQTLSIPDCNNGYGRTFLIAARRATPNAIELSNVTAISCASTYYHSPGILSVTIDPSTGSIPSNLNFTQTSTEEVGNGTYIPAYISIFQAQLQDARIFDPSATLIGTQFGQMVYQYAALIDPDNSLGSENLRTSMEQLLSASFAVMTKLYLIKSHEAQVISGTLQTQELRLLVVRPVAYTMLIILASVIVMLAWIHSYRVSHKSILYEEPKALVGAAAILRHSELMQEIESLDAAGKQGRVGEDFVEAELDRDPQMGWTFENWDKPALASLQRTDRAYEFGFRLTLRRLFNRST